MKEVITELIVDILFRCFEVRENKIKFDKYSLDEDNIQFLLQKLNPEKYKAIEDMLRGDCDD